MAATTIVAAMIRMSEAASSWFAGSNPGAMPRTIHGAAMKMTSAATATMATMSVMSTPTDRQARSSPSRSTTSEKTGMKPERMGVRSQLSTMVGTVNATRNASMTAVVPNWAATTMSLTSPSALPTRARPITQAADTKRRPASVLTARGLTEPPAGRRPRTADLGGGGAERSRSRRRPER